MISISTLKNDLKILDLYCQHSSRPPQPGKNQDQQHEHISTINITYNLDLYCQHSSWPPQQGKPERSWTWLQRLLHVLQTVAISLEWFLDVLAFFCHSFEAILDVSAFFLLLTKMGKKGQWVWCTLDTPDATTHLRLYLVLDKTKDLQFRKFKFLLSWTNF